MVKKQPPRKKPASAPRRSKSSASAKARPAARSRRARKPKRPFERGPDEVDAELQAASGAEPDLEAASEEGVPGRRERTFPLEIDPRRVEESLQKIRGELVHWANKGRYTRVRFKFRGKQLLPDIPLAAVVAAEGLTFYWAGLLRVLVVNVTGGALLNVELINDSEKVVAEGKQAILSGELDEAIAHFRKAIAMDRDNASAQLNLGVALKLKGDREGARVALETARSLDPKGPVGADAERVLSTMPPSELVVASQTVEPSKRDA